MNLISLTFKALSFELSAVNLKFECKEKGDY